jgi:hypothetical protein
MARSGKAERAARKRERPRSEQRATWLIQNICERAGSTNLIGNDAALSRIVETADTPALFDWLIEQISFQGISDRVAAGYLRRHGSITWKSIDRLLAKSPSCPKLKSYWHFHRCGYVKSKQQCSCPEHFRKCPVPQVPLRNGRLNQSAYSLFLFIRDIAEGDLIGWIDRRLHNRSIGTAKLPPKTVTEIVAAMTGIYGIADKIASMTFANMFLAAASRPIWKTAGANLIVVDTLVHNWLERTGLLSTFGKQHVFGSGCYDGKGCAVVIRRLSERIDASGYNRLYPRYFPRFVQHAIWRWCALDHLNTCNGLKIDDRFRCRDRHCILFRGCARRKLTT